MDYTSTKVPKVLSEKFDSKEDRGLYRSFSEFVMESIRMRLDIMPEKTLQTGRKHN